METPHTTDTFKAKKLDDPNVHYHDFSDFPPDFYKADFYHHYAEVGADILSSELGQHVRPSDVHREYEPLKIHSLAKSGEGFYYYDDHHQTSFHHDHENDL